MAYFFFVLIFFLECFVLEDIYGSSIKSPSFIFQSYFGFSIFSILILLILLISFFKKDKYHFSREIKLLFYLMLITQIIEYSRMFFFPNGDTLGSGLLEVRSFFMMVILFLLFKNVMVNQKDQKKITNLFSRISVLSALFYLILYLSGIKLFSVSNYGQTTMFEGAILFCWLFFFIYFLFSSLYSANTKNILSASVNFVALIFSLRRGLILIALFAIIISVFFVVKLVFKKKGNLRLIIVILFSITVLTSIFMSRIETRVNIFSYLNSNSESFELANSSNIGRIKDFIIASNLVANYPILGIGPGVNIPSNFNVLFINNLIGIGMGDSEVVDPSLVHSEYLHFWLRLGILGFIWIILFYYSIIKNSLYIIRNNPPQFDKILGMSILLTFIGYSVLAITFPPFYYYQKMQLVFMFILASTDVMYLSSKQRIKDKVT